ncbi:MAG: hypothetical protein KA174_05095 [Chitinophagales bacterium]|nr:hypothetical protein [Chitinophagales bacterium]
MNNEKFAALQSSEIGNLAAVVGGQEKDTVGAGGMADCARFFDSGGGQMDVDDENNQIIDIIIFYLILL